MSKDKLQVALGPRWSFFATEREGMELLGTVQRGMQIGALAQLADGSYAQVNGDIVEPLNKSRVDHALRAATGPQRFGFFTKTPTPSTAVVTVKKRRKVLLPAP